MGATEEQVERLFISNPAEVLSFSS
jgi:predicted metal-dependent phosphotriesterase family hydrolase